MNVCARSGSMYNILDGLARLRGWMKSWCHGNCADSNCSLAMLECSELSIKRLMTLEVKVPVSQRSDIRAVPGCADQINIIVFSFQLHDFLKVFCNPKKFTAVLETMKKITPQAFEDIQKYFPSCNLRSDGGENSVKHNWSMPFNNLSRTTENFHLITVCVDFDKIDPLEVNALSQISKSVAVFTTSDDVTSSLCSTLEGVPVVKFVLKITSEHFPSEAALVSMSINLLSSLRYSVFFFSRRVCNDRQLQQVKIWQISVFLKLLSQTLQCWIQLRQ